MELRLVNDEEQVLYFEMIKYDKTVIEERNNQYDLFIEETYDIILEEGQHYRFIKKFIFESDEVHADIIFNEDKIFRIFDPSFDFEKGLRIKRLKTNKY